ncbi:hypothetical protein [Kutzneria sp. 744]|uniref:hypothetical protein n=1 Tax=Kutzneria sp. (strain 744) TaxID=345341 RepID=UPI0003EEBB92|nr:hypothetical protein [Kutzneria sp. 744]EWM09943.1 hypothetical protein KUTG_00247 [Kutzneria sp. 744]
MVNPGLHLVIEIDGDGAHPAARQRAAHPVTPRRTREIAAIAENADKVQLPRAARPHRAAPARRRRRQHRASLELFQREIAPVLRKGIPDPPWPSALTPIASGRAN